MFTRACNLGICAIVQVLLYKSTHEPSTQRQKRSPWRIVKEADVRIVLAQPGKHLLRSCRWRAHPRRPWRQRSRSRQARLRRCFQSNNLLCSRRSRLPVKIDLPFHMRRRHCQFTSLTLGSLIVVRVAVCNPSLGRHAVKAISLSQLCLCCCSQLCWLFGRSQVNTDVPLVSLVKSSPPLCAKSGGGLTLLAPVDRRPGVGAHLERHRTALPTTTPARTLSCLLRHPPPATPPLLSGISHTGPYPFLFFYFFKLTRWCFRVFSLLFWRETLPCSRHTLRSYTLSLFEASSYDTV